MAPLALVTGAAHRLGKVFALTLARQGFDILLHYHHSRGRGASDEGGNRIRWKKCNPEPRRISPTLHKSPALIIQQSNTLKVLVNSAAFMPSGNVDLLSIENWDTSLDLNSACSLSCWHRKPPKK